MAGAYLNALETSYAGLYAGSGRQFTNSTDHEKPEIDESSKKPTMADPFTALQLRIDDRPIYCPQAKAALAPGNWVVFKNDDTSFKSDETNETSIGLIMATADDGLTLQVNLFRRVTPAVIQDLQLQSFSNPHYRHIPQIIRTPSAR